jgi:uncharacterized protein with PQ loop repeat
LGAQFRLPYADEGHVLTAAIVTSTHTVPPLANICGFAAGCIGVSMSWPQAWRLWVGRRHAGLSLTANTVGVLYTVGWLLYGVASHSAVQIISCVLGLLGGVAILVGHLVLSRPPVKRWLPLLVTGLVVLGLVASLGRTTMGLVASVATITGVLPQVGHLVRDRRAGHADARGVSRLRWLLSAGCNGLWVVYGVIVGDVVIIGNSSIIATLAILVVVLATPRTYRRAAAGTHLVPEALVVSA